MVKLSGNKRARARSQVRSRLTKEILIYIYMRPLLCTSSTTIYIHNKKHNMIASSLQIYIIVIYTHSTEASRRNAGSLIINYVSQQYIYECFFFRCFV